jgi:hypothetical protein
MRFVSWLGRHPAVLTLVIAAPIALLLGRIASTPWHLTGDYSHTELMVRSIPRHPPLIGVAGRFGTVAQPGAHPGPSMAYLMVPIYRALGSSSWAMLVAAATVHIAAIALAVWLAYRNGGPSAAFLLLAAAAVLVRAQGVEFMIAPWNVWMPFFAFLTFMMLMWGVALAKLGYAPWAVLVGSHAAQTHISYLPLVVGMLGAGLVWLVVLAWRTGQVAWRRLWTTVAVSVGVGLLAWLGPIVEQLRYRPGNLRILARHFLHPPTEVVGAGLGLKGFLGEVNLAGTWWRGGVHDPTRTPSILGLAGFLVLGGVALVVAIRRRDREALILQGTVGAALLIGAIATTRIVGDFYYYVIRWTWVLAALVVVASVWAIWRAVRAALVTRARLEQWRPVVTTMAIAGVVVPAVFTTTDAVSANGPFRNDSDLVGGLAAVAGPQLQHDAQYVLRWHDPVGLSAGAFGLVLELEKRGFDVGVDDTWGVAAQRWRVKEEADVDEVLWFVTGDENIEGFRRLGYRELGRVDARPPADQAESTMLRGRIESGLMAAGLSDLIPKLDAQYGLIDLLLFSGGPMPPDVRRDVGRYTDLRLPGALFAVPPCSLLFPLAPVSAKNPATRPDCDAARAARG